MNKMYFEEKEQSKLTEIKVIDENELRIGGPFSLLRDDDTIAATDLSSETILRIYSEMVFARTFDERAINISMVREIGAYAPFSGQEGVQIGASLAMPEGDWVVPTFRDDAAMMVRGMPPEMILQYWSGDELGMRIPPGLKLLPLTIPVATQMTHAAGLAMAEKLRKTGTAVLVFIGDGGTSKGDFHEALNVAGVYRLPLVIAVENNQYAISVPRSSQTASATLAQKAVAYGIDGVLVDGNDPLACYAATQFAASKAHKESKPVLIEFITYRLRMHTTAELVSDKKRPDNEIEEWRKRDPIERLERALVKVGLLNGEKRERIRKEAEERMKRVLSAFRSFPAPDPLDMFRYLYAKLPRTLAAQANSVKGLSVEMPEYPRARPPTGPSRQMNMRHAINDALRLMLKKDERVVVYGEDVGKNGGVFQVTRDLQQEFGEERVFDTPLAEGAIAGMFLGMSVCGLFPIGEFQFDGFTPPALDQVISHISRIRNRTRGRFNSAGILRFAYGGGVNGLEHHSDTPDVYFASTPGTKVVIPSTPYDAKGLLLAALEDEDPVIFMEPKRLYDSPKMDVPAGEYTVPVGKANTIAEGDDLTVVTYGPMVAPSLEGASGFSADVIDLRTLSPLDSESVIRSVEKTGRLIIVHEGQRMCGIGAEVAARIADEALLSLKAPVKRVTGYDIVVPSSKLEAYYRPGSERVRSAIESVLAY